MVHIVFLKRENSSVETLAAQPPLSRKDTAQSGINTGVRKKKCAGKEKNTGRATNIKAVPVRKGVGRQSETAASLPLSSPMKAARGDSRPLGVAEKPPKKLKSLDATVDDDILPTNETRFSVINKKNMKGNMSPKPSTRVMSINADRLRYHTRKTFTKQLKAMKLALDDIQGTKRDIIKRLSAETNLSEQSIKAWLKKQRKSKAKILQNKAANSTVKQRKGKAKILQNKAANSTVNLDCQTKSFADETASSSMLTSTTDCVDNPIPKSSAGDMSTTVDENKTPHMTENQGNLPGRGISLIADLDGVQKAPSDALVESSATRSVSLEIPCRSQHILTIENEKRPNNMLGVGKDQLKLNLPSGYFTLTIAFSPAENVQTTSTLSIANSCQHPTPDVASKIKYRSVASQTVYPDAATMN